ncbi:hypothetical protein AVEN_131151-1 [Araneus ventricosus]|uniref:Uncharacterized protein n=1 Tax=Araneus ventricosus TaxID=182803 RepID=A0A4Y2RZX7_ARAVE|nr:hypothetical protein AVEN_131151-1 [Araneus ventricosus]
MATVEVFFRKTDLSERDSCVLMAFSRNVLFEQKRSSEVSTVRNALSRVYFLFDKKWSYREVWPLESVPFPNKEVVPVRSFRMVTAIGDGHLKVFPSEQNGRSRDDYCLGMAYGEVFPFRQSGHPWGRLLCRDSHLEVTFSEQKRGRSET